MLAATVPLAVWVRLFREDWGNPIGHEPSIERGQEIIRQTLAAGIIWFAVGTLILYTFIPD